MKIDGKVYGSTNGISEYWENEIEKLYDIPVEKNEIASVELLNKMAEITNVIHKEIAVYITRNGEICKVEVGEKQNVSLSFANGRQRAKGFSGVRLLHTHPGGDGRLSAMDLSALVMLRLDLCLAVGVGEAGKINNIGVSLGTIEGRAPESYLFKSTEQMNSKINFYQKILETEKEIKSLQEDNMVETKERKSRAVLVALSGENTEEITKYSVMELAELAKTAGVEVVDAIIQNKRTPDTATFIGKGKVQELSFMAQIGDIDSFIFDDELSPIQIRNLEMLLGKAIIDRSMLILDIFAGRAQSNEGKLQVELAQLKYMMPRLIGKGEVLSRLGGGIGTRGPGETKLEVDRRAIRKRINELEEKLEKVQKTRKLHREGRKDNGLPLVALVGYTNAGKSTLLNKLTDAGVYAENQLFATLDTTVRRVSLADEREILLSDTVGFIRKLPHHLVAAFRATLEEVTNADLLLHVVDSSQKEINEQVEAVCKVLDELGVSNKPMITVLNKIDKINEDEEGLLNMLLTRFDNSVGISAKEGIGIDELFDKIKDNLPQNQYFINILVPYSNGSLLALVHNNCIVQEEEYQGEGIFLRLICNEKDYNYLKKAGVVND